MNANVDRQRCGHAHHAAKSQGAGPRADPWDAAGFAMPVGRNRWSRTVLIRANLTPCEWRRSVWRGGSRTTRPSPFARAEHRLIFLACASSPLFRPSAGGPRSVSPCRSSGSSSRRRGDAGRSAAVAKRRERSGSRRAHACISPEIRAAAWRVASPYLRAPPAGTGTAAQPIAPPASTRRPRAMVQPIRAVAGD